MLSFSRTRLNHRDDRAFSVAGPTLWNNLPVDIQTAPSLYTFKSMLKSYLFEKCIMG